MISDHRAAGRHTCPGSVLKLHSTQCAKSLHIGSAENAQRRHVQQRYTPGHRQSEERIHSITPVEVEFAPELAGKKCCGKELSRNSDKSAFGRVSCAGDQTLWADCHPLLPSGLLTHVNSRPEKCLRSVDGAQILIRRGAAIPRLSINQHE